MTWFNIAKNDIVHKINMLLLEDSIDSNKIKDLLAYHDKLRDIHKVLCEQVLEIKYSSQEFDADDIPF